jgi:Raf kinase inhibitor-like YbhB/YbcL family protein
MGIGHGIAHAVGQALEGARAGNEKLASRYLNLGGLPRLTVESPAFLDGAELPRSASAEGEGEPPKLTWRGAPEGTRSFVVLCEDPDAPAPKPFVHWLVYGIPADAGALGADAVAGARQGKNSVQKTGYTGAAPPVGHGVHHYHFQVFALDVMTELDYGIGRSRLLDTLRDHVLAWGELVGTYERR